jgi:type IV secretory pathway TrbL component
MGRFWKVLKVIFGIIIGLLFLVAAVNAVTFEWAIICTSMFLMMFCQVMWEVCE